jgi:hypothetical protein
MIVSPRSPVLLGRIVERIARLSPRRHRDVVRGMVAELDSIADPAERRRFALGAIAAIARLVLSEYTRPATTWAGAGGTMWGKTGCYDKAYFRMVAIALLPALGVSITTQVIGRMVGGSESVVDRVSQILHFSTFLAACHYIRARRTSTRT